MSASTTNATRRCDVTVFRPDEGPARERDDTLAWLRLPIDERVELAWQLSLEQWGLAHPDEEDEPGLSRPAWRLQRR